MNQENCFEGIRTVHPNRLTPKGIVILVVIGILLLALALYLIPWPERVSFRTTGAEIDRYGNVKGEGEYVVEGWRYHFLFKRDEFRLTHLQLPNIELGEPDDYSSTISPFSQNSNVETTHCVLWNSKQQKIEPIRIWTTSNFDFFVIMPIHSNERLFIGAEEGLEAYLEILEMCWLLED